MSKPAWAEIVAAAWVRAGYPDHDFAPSGDHEHDLEVCTTCAGTQAAVQHVDWSKGMQAHDALYLAETHMRALHRPLDDDYQFWGGLADMLNTWACRGLHHSVRSPREINDFNKHVAFAYGYLDMVKRGRG
jgi:hypothetical protein